MTRKINLTALTTSLLASSLMSSTAMADEGPSLTIKNFIGTIDWTQGDRLDVDIKRDGDTLNVSGDESALIIDGGLDDVDTSNCSGYLGKYSFSWSWGKKDETNSKGRFGGYKDLDDFPDLSITVPANTRIIIKDAIPFITGTPNILSLDADIRGCGDLEIGDSNSYINFTSKGSGGLSAGNTPEADVRVSGSGDVEFGDVGDFVLRISGSGNGDIGSIGNAEISVTGSGDVEAGDVSGNVLADSRGSGDITFGDISGNLSYVGRGSGDFHATSANGHVSLESFGSGDIEIEGGEASALHITASGSSDVEFNGTAVNADLNASGSSDIEVYRVTGELNSRDNGSADVNVRKTK